MTDNIKKNLFICDAVNKICDAVRKREENFINEVTQEIKNSKFNIINEMLNSRSNGWISVKEKYPDDGQEVIFYVKNRGTTFSGYFKKNENILNIPRKNVFRDNLSDWWFEDEEITLWFPLPELPKE